MKIFNKDTSNPDNIELMDHAKRPLSSHAVLAEVPLELEKAWSTIDVLKHLIWATEYLLNEKDYDGHNHEELNICVKRGVGNLPNNYVSVGWYNKDHNYGEGKWIIRTSHFDGDVTHWQPLPKLEG